MNLPAASCGVSETARNEASFGEFTLRDQRIQDEPSFLKEGKEMKKVLVGTFILLSVLLFAVWSFAADTIKIGGFLPMTGAVAAYGQDANNGIAIAMEMRPTVLGKKVEFVVADTKSDKIEAANAMSRLIEKEKVIAVIGEMISGDTMAGEAARFSPGEPTKGRGRRRGIIPDPPGGHSAGEIQSPAKRVQRHGEQQVHPTRLLSI